MNEQCEGTVSEQEQRMSELQAFWAMQSPNTFADMSKSISERRCRTGGSVGKGLR